MKIIVLKMSKFVTDETLAEHFRPFGTVSSATVVMDKVTGQSKRFGFVEMPNYAEAQAAIRALHHSIFLKQKIRVKEANKPPAAPFARTQKQKFHGKPEFKERAERPYAKPAASTDKHVAGKKSRGAAKPGWQSPAELRKKPFGIFMRQDDSGPALAPRHARRFAKQRYGAPKKQGKV